MTRTWNVLAPLAACAALALVAACAPSAAKYASWHEGLMAALQEIGPAQKKVSALDAVEPTDDLGAYKDTMRQLVAALDEYDPKLSKVLGVVDSGLAGSFLTPAQKDQYAKLKSALEVEREISKVSRERAQTILAFEPDGKPHPEVLEKARKLEAELARLEGELAQKMKDAGVPGS